MKNLLKTGILCLAFSIVLLVAVSAATPREMYENGVVSDDGIRLGDARDGEITDVSEGGEIFTGATMELSMADYYYGLLDAYKAEEFGYSLSKAPFKIRK
jgi:hypothetical protein